MLAKQSIRLATPAITQHVGPTATRATTMQWKAQNRLSTLSRPVVRAAPLSVVSVPSVIAAAKSVSMHISSASSGSSSSSDTASSYPNARLWTAAAVAGLLAYALTQLEGEQYDQLRAQLSAKLAELRATFGLTMDVAECERAPSSTPTPKLNFEAAAATASAHPIIGVDAQLASWWKRLAAYIVDNALITLIDVITVQLLNAVFFGDSVERALELAFSSGYLSVSELVLAAISTIVWDVVWSVYCNGLTPGKRLLRIRTVKQDGSAMDTKTAFQLGVTRAVLMPAGALDVVLPIFPPTRYLLKRALGEDLSKEKQALHNYVSSTIVIDDRQQAEDDGDD